MKALVFLLFLALATESFATTSPIKHIVVLMMENRSFDHLLGYLKQDGWPEVDGLTGKFSFAGYSPVKGAETNPYNTKEPHGKHERVNNHGYDRSPDDPGLY